MKRLMAVNGLALGLLFTGSLVAVAAVQAQAGKDAAVTGGAVGDDTVFINGFGEAPDVVRARRGFAIAPVPLDMVFRDPVQVGLGSYLVNSIGACSECHTNPPYAPGGNPFMGEPKQVNTSNYLAGGQAFGPFLSRNITPSLDNGLPAGLTFAEFEDVMRHGTDFSCTPEDPPPCPLLQVMPWPVYQYLSDTDLHAIYEYLSTIPHAEPGA